MLALLRISSSDRPHILPEVCPNEKFHNNNKILLASCPSPLRTPLRAPLRAPLHAKI